MIAIEIYCVTYHLYPNACDLQKGEAIAINLNICLTIT